MKPVSRIVCSVVFSLVLLTGSIMAGETSPMPAAPPPPEPHTVKVLRHKTAKPTQTGTASRLFDIISLMKLVARLSLP